MTTFSGTGAPELVFGSDGPDSLDGAGGNDSLNGGLDRDTLLGGAGDDQLDGGGDNTLDFLNGGGDNDFIYGGYRDRLTGGSGSDYFQIYFSNGADDVIDLSGLTLGGHADLPGGGFIDGFEYGQLYTGAGNDTVTAAAMPVSIYGGAGNDTLTGNDLSNDLDGGADLTNDADLLRGFGGGDQLYGGTGDTFNGGEGLDYVSVDLTATSAGLDFALGALAGGGALNLGDGTRLISIEDGQIWLGTGNDRVRYQDFDAMTMLGGDGADTLLGGAGDDYMEGGTGDDSMVGGFGVDSANFYFAAVGCTVDLRISAAQNTGLGMDVIKSIENVVATQHDDSVRLSNASGFAGGLNGNDTLVGGNGNDSLTGGYNATSAPDDDRLTGGGGQDTLTGGAGGDRFIFLSLADSTNAASDLIYDLADEDIIDLKKIDADSTTIGNQTFSLVSAIGDGKAKMILSFDGSATYLRFYVNGDTIADGTIRIVGDHHDFTHFVP
ncbi:MAG: calcium-binding protein [Caulobacteraceae bacterium]